MTFDLMPYDLDALNLWLAAHPTATVLGFSVNPTIGNVLILWK